jgi:hypothetical protein
LGRPRAPPIRRSACDATIAAGTPFPVVLFYWPVLTILLTSSRLRRLISSSKRPACHPLRRTTYYSKAKEQGYPTRLEQHNHEWENNASETSVAPFCRTCVPKRIIRPRNRVEKTKGSHFSRHLTALRPKAVGCSLLYPPAVLLASHSTQPLAQTQSCSSKSRQ